jgi:ABC-type Fe3+-citrate transport system substrate-binding protein
VFEATGGHHPGSGGVLVQTDAGRVGILETAFLQRNIEEALPVGIAEDAAQARRVIRHYREEADQVLASHDPGVVDTLHRFGVSRTSARTTD